MIIGQTVWWIRETTHDSWYNDRVKFLTVLSGEVLAHDEEVVRVARNDGSWACLFEGPENIARSKVFDTYEALDERIRGLLYSQPVAGKKKKKAA